jgi:hypothetical protein
MLGEVFAFWNEEKTMNEDLKIDDDGRVTCGNCGSDSFWVVSNDEHTKIIQLECIQCDVVFVLD